MGKKANKPGFVSRVIQAGLSKVVPKILRYHQLVPSGPVAEGLFAVRSGIANFFILRSGPDIIAIDTGVPGDAASRGLEALGLVGDDVSHVFLTHSDWDHTGGLPTFGRAQVFLPVGEEPLIDGRVARGNAGYYSPPLSCSYTLVKEGETVDVGGYVVEVIAAPGHTQGSVAYRVGGRLFTGDAIRLKKGRALPAFRLYNMDTKQLEQSLRRLAGLDGIDLLCTAHTGISRDFAYAMARWREN